jgi:hypothetical protein
MATTYAERVMDPAHWPTREVLEENLREVRHAVTAARHAAEDVAADAALTIRRHPLRAVAGGVIVAGLAGVVVGFGAGWFARAGR